MKFSYFLPTRLSFGFGTVGTAGAEAKALGASKALIVTDRVMVKTGIAQRVTDSLGGVGFDVYDEVEAEPRIEVAQAVAEKVRSAGYDVVVGVGGGSSMDMAKVAAGFATNRGPAVSFVGNNLFPNRPLPSIMVPTTAGTGAELTVTSMVTVEGHKQWINSALLLPSVAVVDPELTMSMPPGVTAATGMDALCHNTEAYLSALASPITDSAALEGVGLIVQNLDRAYEAGGDRGAREGMSLGALMGGIALQAKMVYGHSIGYTIATRFKLPHGVSCGLPLPYMISNYAVACAPKMKRLAQAYGVAPSEDPGQTGMAIAEKVTKMAAHLKIPTTLKALGVAEADLPALADECVKMYPRPNSPLVFDERSMSQLYRRMWEGRLEARGRRSDTRAKEETQGPTYHEERGQGPPGSLGPHG
ncbi:MAG: iron-containing alcohol dehydrogenase [Nitrososphaerota archaeon]|nr:iron-containing alcohol dehydrogenase [Nitrososphaerota archaeon]MDG7023549.1 iron-containing alcohol dehydrogenase [Nitrososphaerota archaeon]